MKFTIDKNIILENLMNVARAISTKNVIPVLNGIKFEMTNEGLYLTASDSELTIKSFIEKKDIKNVEALGNIIIQSKFIVDIIRKMPSDIIDFEVVDGLKIKLTSGSSECSLNCLDSSEYPQIDLEEHKTPIYINNRNPFFTKSFYYFKHTLNFCTCQRRRRFIHNQYFCILLNCFCYFNSRIKTTSYWFEL